MEKIATSFCSFEVLRKRYTYVDKTDMLWRLVSDSEDLKTCPVVMLDMSKVVAESVDGLREKGYAAQFKGGRRPVTLVGVNFRPAKRNIDEPLFASF